MSDAARRPLIVRFFNGLWTAVVWFYRLVVIAMLAISLSLLWVSLKGQSKVLVEDNLALVVAPTGALVEQIDLEPAQRLAEQFAGETPSQTLLRDLIDSLDEAAQDSRISMAVVKLDGLAGAGLAQLDELNAAIERFKASGKPVHAYAPSYEQSHYYVAAHADDISIDPLGMVAVEGLSSQQLYFKDALDKLGIDINVFRVGEYKSAVEPFIRNDMSEEAKAANRDWLGDLWRHYGEQTTTARKLKPEAVDQYVSGFAEGLKAHGGDAAALAKEAGLVTHVETLQQFRERIGKVVGMDDDIGSFRQIWSEDYLHAVHTTHRSSTAEHRIGLVVVQGEIVDGQGEPGVAGGDTIAELLDEARRDEGIDAVVLRVDSPGGSVYASEQIRRAVQALRADGKPVVASMSAVAASGGYWISMAADRIFAHESTITGSIGIFGLIPTIDRPLAKLGIHSDGVGTTPLAGAMRIDKPLSPQVRRIIQSSIDKGYRDFINGVAEGRKMEPVAVDKIARGRVWSGLKAKDLGLVDEFGGLDAAVKSAAKLARLDEGSYELEEFHPGSGSPFQALFQFFGQAAADQQALASVSGLISRLSQARELRASLGWLNDPRGAYARCFCSLQLDGQAR